MMKKKKLMILVSISIFIAIFLFFIIIILTRVVYLNNYDVDEPAMSDADYLDVSDLRLLELFHDNKVNRQLENLTQDMIQESYKNNGISAEYTSIIDNDSFKRLNPNYSGIKQTAYELNNIHVECLTYKNKAIVYWNKECILEENSNIINCNLNTKTPPFDRLYFEKIDGEWKVVSFMQLA